MELYVKYGGTNFWSHFIEVFYEKVTKDPLLRDVFANRNMHRIKEMQLSLLEMTLTDNRFPEAVMVEMHRRLGILETQFARFVETYQKTLLDLGVEPADVGHMVELLQSYKSQVTLGTPN